MTDLIPFSLFVRGPNARIFALSDILGFDDDMTALAVSVFEDGPASMHVQALYETEQAANAARAKLDLEGLEHFVTKLPDEDWVAKSQSGLPPVMAGRFFVHGTHDQNNIPTHAIYPILVDAGIAFGTGHHGTTKGCLLAFEYLLSAQTNIKNILDLGTGTGVLAIAASKALNVTVLATDIDQDAVDVTNANAKANSVADRIDAAWSDGMNAEPIKRNAPYDLIFANILAGPLVGMANDIAKGMRRSGYAILSGILDEQAKNVQAAFEDEGLSVYQAASYAGWTTFTMIKT